jgi:hypothetical protein
VKESDEFVLCILQVLMFFKYCLENYDFDYLFKTDDDSFVRPDTLMKHIHYFPKTRVYMGTYRYVLGILSNCLPSLSCYSLVVCVCSDYKGKIGPIQETRLPQVYAGTPFFVCLCL